MKKEKNIYTIAKEAGVSPATVSRVMTKNARVSEEKRKKVEEMEKRTMADRISRGCTVTCDCSAYGKFKKTIRVSGQ